MGVAGKLIVGAAGDGGREGGGLDARRENQSGRARAEEAPEKRYPSPQCPPSNSR